MRHAARKLTRLSPSHRPGLGDTTFSHREPPGREIDPKAAFGKVDYRPSNSLGLLVARMRTLRGAR